MAALPVCIAAPSTLCGLRGSHCQARECAVSDVPQRAQPYQGIVERLRQARGGAQQCLDHVPLMTGATRRLRTTGLSERASERKREKSV